MVPSDRRNVKLCVEVLGEQRRDNHTKDLLRAIMSTALDDELVVLNPVWIQDAPPHAQAGRERDLDRYQWTCSSQWPTSCRSNTGRECSTVAC